MLHSAGFPPKDSCVIRNKSQTLYNCLPRLLFKEDRTFASPAKLLDVHNCRTNSHLWITICILERSPKWHASMHVDFWKAQTCHTNDLSPYPTEFTDFSPPHPFFLSLFGFLAGRQNIRHTSMQQFPWSGILSSRCLWPSPSSCFRVRLSLTLKSSKLWCFTFSRLFPPCHLKYYTFYQFICFFYCLFVFFLFTRMVSLMEAGILLIIFHTVVSLVPRTAIPRVVYGSLWVTES